MWFHKALAAYREVAAAPVAFRSAANAAPPGRRPPQAAADDARTLEPDFGVAGPAAAAAGGALPARAPGLQGQRQRKRQRQRQRQQLICLAVWRRTWGLVLFHTDFVRGGLALPLQEARELLQSEGLPPREMQELLSPFEAEGFVPQAAIFGFLCSWTGALDDPAEPAPVRGAERKAARVAPVAPELRAPVLA
mmetsp:Transcript_121851/g.389965  ORF Transcript_121851/g.389965 Transcript_121851/m.389965 type:complete len:193 (-) Transcript_121851:29-607(-)